MNYMEHIVLCLFQTYEDEPLSELDPSLSLTEDADLLNEDTFGTGALGKCLLRLVRFSCETSASYTRVKTMFAALIVTCLV